MNPGQTDRRIIHRETPGIHGCQDTRPLSTGCQTLACVRGDMRLKEECPPELSTDQTRRKPFSRKEIKHEGSAQWKQVPQRNHFHLPAAR